MATINWNQIIEFFCFSVNFFLLFNYVECYEQIESTEIFGPPPSTVTPLLSSSSSTLSAANISSNRQPLNSKSFSLKNIFSSFSSNKSSSLYHPSRQEVPLTDFAISHPLISDSNARIPLYLYNPGLARKIGLSTLLMTSVIYGLTILPALLTVTGNLPFSSGIMSSLTGRKRKRRSFYLRNYYELPLMDKQSTEKFLSLLETTWEIRKVNSTLCKRYHLCKIYQKALTSDEKPITLGTFERALVNIFGLAAERRDSRLKLVPTVKLYSEAALVAMTGSNCTLIYPCAEDIKYSQGLSYF